MASLSLHWYVCLFGYASRPETMEPTTLSVRMMGAETIAQSSITSSTTQQMKKRQREKKPTDSELSMDDDNDEETTSSSSLTLLTTTKKKKKKKTWSTETTPRPRTKTVNRTVLAITLFPTSLRDYMNAGDDEVISTSVNQGIKKLKSIDGQFFKINDTPERFNIINIVGPVDDIVKARQLADEIVKSRGERPRTVAAHTCATRENLEFAVDWQRFFSVEAVDHDVEVLSSSKGGTTRYKLTKKKRQRSD